MNAFIEFFQSFDNHMLLKFVVLFFLGFFTVFTFVVLTQVRTMTRLEKEMYSSTLILMIAFLLFFSSIALFLLGLAIL